MKFHTNANALEAALNTVKGAVPRKTTLPILETILFEFSDGNLKLTATDLDIAIAYRAHANIEIEGRVAIPAQRLIDTLQRLPDIPVSFEVDESFNIKFSTEKGMYKLIGENPADFPEIPELKSAKKVHTNTKQLLRGIKKTLFAVSADDLRPAMMGVYIKPHAMGATFVATDGHQLAEYTNSHIKAEGLDPFIVPKNALSLAKNTLQDDDDCMIALTDRHVQFNSGNTTIVSRLINEKYPSYESVIPSDNNKLMFIGKDQMIATVNRVSIFSNSNTNQVRLTIGGDKCIIRAEDIDMSSEARETISCDYDDDEIEIGFNAKFLSDILKNTGSDRVEFAFSSPNRAGIITPVKQKNGENLRMLVMPIMLKSYA